MYHVPIKILSQLVTKSDSERCFFMVRAVQTTKSGQNVEAVQNLHVKFQVILATSNSLREMLRGKRSQHNFGHFAGKALGTACISGRVKQTDHFVLLLHIAIIASDEQTVHLWQKFTYQRHFSRAFL